VSGTDGFADANFVSAFGDCGDHNTGNTNRADNDRDDCDNRK